MKHRWLHKGRGRHHRLPRPFCKSIIEDVEDSLRRLHTDHLDVLYTHWQTPDFGIYPLEETVEA